MKKEKFCILMLSVLTASCLLVGCGSGQSNYNKGVTAQENGEYEEAIEYFSQAGDYEDASERLTECIQINNYNQGIAAQENESYEEAIEYFSQAGDYEDASERLDECNHMIDVLSDTTAPNIGGFDENINVTCGTEFNLNDYIAEKIEISDDVTDDIQDYSISVDDDVYDRGTGNVTTTETGEYEVNISATDEAGNTGEQIVTLSINPVVVSKDDPNPVIYDGEYATITLKEFKHGEIYEYSDMYGYSATFEVENKCDEAIDVYWSSYTSINNYQVSAYYELMPIAAGNIGTAFTYIEDSNIPESAGNYSQIDAIVCIKYESGSESFYRIPTTFYTDAAE